MRVTIVTETFSPQVNGVSRALGELSRRLRERGDAVQIIHPDYGDPPRPPDARPARSIRLPFYSELRLPIPPFGSIHRAVESFAPDLIHVATEAFLGLALLRFASRRSIPVVSSFHTNFDQYGDHYGVGWARPLIGSYLRWFHNRTIETFVPSRTTIARLESRGYQRLSLWPRGVDGTLFHPARPGREAIRARLGWKPDDVGIIHVGRLAPEKNVDELARALAIVSERRPRVRLLFVGDGPSRARVETRLAGLARFVGFRSGSDLADHYAAGDLFAIASKTETFGNVVLEAMATGLPVVALGAGGVVETVRDGETGALLDESATPINFADALIGLVDRGDERRRLGLAARRHAETRDWDAIMDGLRERYVGVISSARPPKPLVRTTP